MRPAIKDINPRAVIADVQPMTAFVDKAMAPIRFTTNALRPAVANASLSYQKPMSRNEHRPTPSQPMNKTGRFEPSTRINIEPVNRFR